MNNINLKFIKKLQIVKAILRIFNHLNKKIKKYIFLTDFASFVRSLKLLFFLLKTMARKMIMNIFM